MTRFLTIFFIALIFEAIGVVYLSTGLKEIGGEVKQITVSEIVRLIKFGATNKHILLGVLFEALFFGGLCYQLSQKDVSLVWPMTALSIVVTTLTAKIFLHENISVLRWAGISLIVIGAAVTAYSEKDKEKAAKAAENIPASADSSLR